MDTFHTISYIYISANTDNWLLVDTGKFQNKYRIPSVRAYFHDYTGGAYFVTICTKNRKHFFGEIINGQMQLSPIGEITKTEWLKTIELRADMNLRLGEFVVMPNHFHAIIIIGENEYNKPNVSRRDAMHCVSTIYKNNKNSKNEFGPQSKNLASIIRGFKMSVTTNARKLHAGFAWQTRYHDHIIRNPDEMNRITDYIKNNVSNWGNDRLNKR